MRQEAKESVEVQKVVELYMTDGHYGRASK